MEKIESDLKTSEEKQSSLRSAYESLHAEANSVILFSVQWKELEEQFESTRSEIRTRLQELENREKEIDDRRKRLETSELIFDSEMAAKAVELRGIEKSIAEKVKEYESGKLRLKSVNLSIDVKERRVSDVESLVREKERECDSIDRCIEERKKIMDWFVKNAEERSVEIEAKEKEVEEVRTVLNKYRYDIELKESRLNSIVESIEERTKVYDLREEEIKRAERWIEECDKKMRLRMEKLSLVEKSIEECDKEMKLKGEKLSLIRRSLAEFSDTLESRENAIMELESKERDFYLLKKSMEEWSGKLEYKEKELGEWLEKLELKEKGFEQKLEEFHLIDKRVNECFNEVQLKEKHLDSLSNGLQVKERKLELQARTLEFKQKKFDSICNSTEERYKKMTLEKKTNILNSQVKIEQLEHNPINNPSVPLPTSIQSRINSSGKDLQLFLNEHLKRHDLLGTEISGILQASSDPAKLVLDAMQGFYPSSSDVENRECDFDLSVIRRSCILLLQELKRVSLQINPLVREEARKLASDWKDKMIVAVENWLEVLGFLLLVTTYDLTSTYPESELQSLILVAGQQAHVAQATELSLGISDKAPECSITSVKNVEPESSLAKSGATLSSPNLQPSATIDARTLQEILIEHMKQKDSMQKEMLAALQMSSNPAKLVLDVMQTSFAHYWSKGEVGLEETFMSSMIALLEELMRVSPNVGPVKEDAIKLAYTWKAKMEGNTENSLESLGYLQFLATYRLLYCLNEDEIRKILGMIYQHKQALKICQTLGFVPEFVQKLIERKQLLEAVRLICTFNITDKFPPVPLIKEYVEGARKSCRTMWRKKKSLDEKDEVVDHLIADLRAATQCFADYNLESDYPSKGIKILIIELEKMKENWRRSAQSLVSTVRQEVKEPSPASKVGQEGKKEKELSPASKVGQEGKKEKNQSPSSKVGQEEKKASPSSKVGQEEKKSPPSSKVGQEEEKPSPASKVGQEVKKVKKLGKKAEKLSLAIKVGQEVKKVKKPSLASKVGRDDKAEKKLSLASTVEQEEKTEKNPSLASTIEQEEKTENPSLTSTVEQEDKTEKKPSASTVEQEEKEEKKPLASMVEQEDKNEKKSSAGTSGSTFQRQEGQRKRPRTCV